MCVLHPKSGGKKDVDVITLSVGFVEKGIYVHTALTIHDSRSGSSPVSTHLSAVVDRPAHVQTTRIKKISPRLRHPIELKSSLCAIVCRNLSSQSATSSRFASPSALMQHTSTHKTTRHGSSSHLTHTKQRIFTSVSHYSVSSRATPCHGVARLPPFFSPSSFLVSRRVHSLDRLDHLLLKRRRLHLCHTTNHCR